MVVLSFTIFSGLLAVVLAVLELGGFPALFVAAVLSMCGVLALILSRRLPILHKDLWYGLNFALSTGIGWYLDRSNWSVLDYSIAGALFVSTGLASIAAYDLYLIRFSDRTERDADR